MKGVQRGHGKIKQWEKSAERLEHLETRTRKFKKFPG